MEEELVRILFERRGSQVGCRSALSGLPDYKERRR